MTSFTSLWKHSVTLRPSRMHREGLSHLIATIVIGSLSMSHRTESGRTGVVKPGPGPKPPNCANTGVEAVCSHQRQGRPPSGRRIPPRLVSLGRLTYDLKSGLAPSNN